MVDDGNAEHNDHVADLVDDLVHGALSNAESDRVIQHITRCDKCRAALSDAESRRSTYLSLPAIEASSALIETTINQIKSAKPQPPRMGRKLMRWATVAVAACALILASLHAYVATWSANPIDLRVLAQDQWLPDSVASIRVSLVNFKTGAPVADAPILVQLQNSETDWVTIGEFKSSNELSAAHQVRIPDWAEGKYKFRVVAHSGGEDDEILERSVRISRRWKLMLSTDKPVYQPGQVIRIRSLAMKKPGLKPIAGVEALFTIRDARQNLVFKEAIKTSRFGISAASFPLANEVFEGTYTIQCEVSGTKSTRTVEVRKYSLPKIQIQTKLDKPYYLRGEMVNISATVGYFFGKPIKSAKYQLEVQDGAAILHRSRGIADASGAIETEFLVPHELNVRDDENKQLKVVLRAEDAAQQTHTVSATCLVAPKSVRINVIPESGTLVHNVANRVFIMATYPDGRPVNGTLDFGGLAPQAKTNELGFAMIEFTPTEDELAFTIQVDDGEAVTQHPVRLSAGTMQGDYLARTNKSIYRSGDSIRFSVLASGGDPVFVDVVQDGQSLLSQTINIESGRGETIIDIPSEVLGAVQLVTYRFNTDGIPIRKVRSLYVRENRELNLVISMDKPEYRPGDTAEMTVRLTDEDNNPVAGAISLAAVDEAVFAVLQNSTGMEETFFRLQDELLKPIYTIYNWTPNRKGPSQELWEQFNELLFAKTNQVLAGRSAVPINVVSAKPTRSERRLNRKFGSWAGKGSFFSLSGMTYPAKARQLRSIRNDANGNLVVAWCWLMGSSIFLVLAVVAYRYPIGFLIGLGVVVLISLILPTIGSMQEKAADSARALSNEAETKSDGKATGSEGPSLRVRHRFPETLLWRPELITDETGTAKLQFDVADSITSWRLSASAVTEQGQLTSLRSHFRVFKPLFVDVNAPRLLTRNDSLHLPIVVYNYSNQTQAVTVEVKSDEWFNITGNESQSWRKQLSVKAGETAAVQLPIKAVQVGKHPLEILVKSSQFADAVRREVEVEAEGRVENVVHSGSLRADAQERLTVPQQAIDGSISAVLRVHGAVFNHIVDGLDGIFRMPHGCFEQTSSATYPNVMALRYLQETDQSLPQVEMKARQYIHIGYQRLLSFEVSGGGFDWYGRSPASVSLTAYGLMEFEDMSKVHEVDPDLIKRTRRWLLQKQNVDGTWTETSRLFRNVRSNPDDDPRLALTAYIAWAAFKSGESGQQAAATKKYLLAQPPVSIEKTYDLALVILALRRLDASEEELAPYITKLERSATQTENGRCWPISRDYLTTFYGRGKAGSVESTALALLALKDHTSDPTLLIDGLEWLIANKDANRSWHSTQATILALKCLVELGDSIGGNSTTTHTVDIVTADSDGKQSRESMTIKPDQADVTQQLNLTKYFIKGKTTSLSIESATGKQLSYHFHLKYNVPDEKQATQAKPPLSIALDLDPQQISVGDKVPVTVRVTNNTSRPLPMVMVDLPIPPGFEVNQESLDAWKRIKTVGKTETTPRQIIVYLRSLADDNVLELKYELRAVNQADVTLPPAQAYEYYDPDRRSQTRPQRIVVGT